MTDFVQPPALGATRPWAALERKLGGTAATTVVFALVYAASVALDFALQHVAGMPPILCTALGVLTFTLWLAEPRNWPAISVIHLLTVLVVGTIIQPQMTWSHLLSMAFAQLCAAFAGSLTGRWVVPEAMAIRVLQVLQIFTVAVVGALVGALLSGGIENWFVPGYHSYPQQVWLWWCAGCLGVITTGPVVMAWVMRVWSPYPELVLRSRFDLAIIGSWVVVATVMVFWLADRNHSSLLPLPLLIGPVLVVGCFRLPPRWAITLAAVAVVLASLCDAQPTQRYLITDPLVRVGTLQALFGIFASICLTLSMVLTQVRFTVAQLRQSEMRYRDFVKLTTEAVWRVEIEPPMPVALTHAEQIQWLSEHARIAESSETYDRIGGERIDAPTSWKNLPWREAFESQLDEAAKKNFFIYDLKFTTINDRRVHSYLASFSAVVEGQKLHRLWGVARDVTELVDLNGRLLREQQRLKSYAREIVSAEEKARRATAVDLHDGIGQSLVSMAMMLEVARQQIAPDVRLLVDEIRGRLRDVQEHTRRMISDLSPPGLYDLGLGPALQWLSVYSRTHDGLRVDLDLQVQESAISIDLRVLVFKLVRELLRNVVKHAGVSAARVVVRGDALQLRVEVSDEGRGFEWQIDMFGARSGGFGLWSVADRISEVGGTFQVEASVGRGARFSMIMPLNLESGAATSGTYAVRGAERGHALQ